MNANASLNYSRLSLRDLIEARDLFHAHLINRRNVVATAIGRYLIRKADLDENGQFKKNTGKKRTLANSVVLDISWPCILVFVNQWEEPATLVGHETNDLVPKTIYMPDGRTVPVCTVEAPRQSIDNTSVDVSLLRFPDNLIGGGYPLVMHSQGIDRVATVGCVVSDGHTYYALSNKHVTGDGGEEVFTNFGCDRRRIGYASEKSLAGVPFSRLYPGWTSKDLAVRCDAGLIQIEDVRQWKTDVFSLGAFGELFDLNTFNLGLDIIAEHTVRKDQVSTLCGKVVGYGAVSGKMEGEIAALFYRYKSIGGKEYVSDFLISGREGADLATHHGDSGTLWLHEDTPPTPRAQAKGNKKGAAAVLRPIALHWGQHEFITDGGESGRQGYSYGLATSLSNICRELDVDLVRGWNADSEYTWGKVGHYTVAARAIELISDPDLKKLMEANREKITFPNKNINADLDTSNNPGLPKKPEEGLCPLADVPDIIWKQSKKTTEYGRMGDENPNHYADADAPSTDGKNLFELCDESSKLTVQVWTDYYDGIDRAAIGMDPGSKISKGLICFRVWQIYDYMIDAMSLPKQERAAHFIFAAGVLAHYVGDGCQPLHSSYMSNGDPADNVQIMYTAKATSKNHAKGDVYPKIVNPGDGVHAAYEDKMIDAKIDVIFPALKKHPVDKEKIAAIDSGQEAGFAVLTLMKKSQETIPPKSIVEAFKTAKKKQLDVTEALYEEFGDGTTACLARGSNYLAAIWDAAWKNGGGKSKITKLVAVDDSELIDLYSNPDELPSKFLDTIGALLK